MSRATALALWILLASTSAGAHAHAEHGECARDVAACMAEKRAEISSTASIGGSVSEVEIGLGQTVFRVVAVEPGGPASDADLRVDDWIIAWNGTDVEAATVRDFLHFHRRLEVGQEVAYEVLRQAKTSRISIVAGERSRRSVEISLRRFAQEVFGCDYASIPEVASVLSEVTSPPPGREQ